MNLKYTLIVLLTLTVPFIKPTSVAAQVNCYVDTEDPSNLKRTLNLANYGFSLDIPVNYRAMATKDGNVSLLDNGSFESLQCHQKNPGAYGGRGIESTIISRFTERNIYSHVRDAHIFNKNILVVVQPNVPFEGAYKVALRFKTSKGTFEIQRVSDMFAESEEDVRLELDWLDQFAKTIRIK